MQSKNVPQFFHLDLVEQDTPLLLKLVHWKKNWQIFDVFLLETQHNWTRQDLDNYFVILDEQWNAQACVLELDELCSWRNSYIIYF